jgi:hypothetical protein
VRREPRLPTIKETLLRKSFAVTMLSTFLFFSGSICAQSSNEGISEFVQIFHKDDSTDTAASREIKSQTSPTAATSSSITPNALAPPLSQIFVNNVCSPNVGCETILGGQTRTALIHSGSYVYVYVWEIGYGSGESAAMSGSNLGSQYLVSKDAVCQSGSSYTTSCPNGSTIVGWRYVWNVIYYITPPFNGPVFTAKDTSSVSPYNTLSTFPLTIQH